MAKIRFGKGPGGDFENLPEGTYDFEIKSLKESTSKSNNPQLTVKLEVVEPAEFAGKTHTEWFSLLPAAIWRLEKFCEAAGVTVVDTGEVDEKGSPIKEFDPEDLQGKFVRCPIEHRTWEGKVRSNLSNDPEPSTYGAAGDTAAAAPSTKKPTPAAQPADGAAPGAPAVAPRRPRPAA